MQTNHVSACPVNHVRDPLEVVRREGARFPWGEELEPDGDHRCNVWQGEFPDHNAGEDGNVSTALVNAFDPKGYGVSNVCGNVWEWCRDWFSPIITRPMPTTRTTRPARGRRPADHTWRVTPLSRVVV